MNHHPVVMTAGEPLSKALDNQSITEAVQDCTGKVLN